MKRRRAVGTRRGASPRTSGGCVRIGEQRRPQVGRLDVGDLDAGGHRARGGARPVPDRCTDLGHAGGKPDLADECPPLRALLRVERDVDRLAEWHDGRAIAGHGQDREIERGFRSLRSLLEPQPRAVHLHHHLDARLPRAVGRLQARGHAQGQDVARPARERGGDEVLPARGGRPSCRARARSSAGRRGIRGGLAPRRRDDSRAPRACATCRARSARAGSRAGNTRTGRWPSGRGRRRDRWIATWFRPSPP